MGSDKLARAIAGVLPDLAGMASVSKCPIPARVKSRETNPPRPKPGTQRNLAGSATRDAEHPSRPEMSRDVAECPGMSPRTGEKFDGSNPPLTLRQRAAARLLVRGMAVGKVADSIGIDRRTIARWKSNPTFLDHLDGLAQQADLS